MAVLLAGAVLASAAVGQQAPVAAPVSGAASPLLPPGHWALDAARRVEALGLVRVPLPPRATLSRREVGTALREAATATGDPAARALAEAWYGRLLAEFPELGGGAAGARLLGSAVEAGYLARGGREAPGTGEAPNHTGALPLPDGSDAAAVLDLAAALGDPLAASVTVRQEGDLDLARWDVRVSRAGVELAVGREAVGYGTGVTGGIVLSGREPLERVELSTRRVEPLRGWLGVLGPLGFHTFVARLPEDRHPDRPVLWGASGTLQPHPRLQLSVHRGALVGGDRVEEPVSGRSVLLMLVGKHAGIENQIVSGEARYRLPTERWMPVTAYCEVGAEDSAGSVTSVPGFLCGGVVPLVPGVPGLAVGVEHARFGAVCCGNPPWYRHWMFPGSWSGAEEPLGHPLGGCGSEWLGHAQWSDAGARTWLEGRAFRRERSGDNLFVPGREGRSVGGAATGEWRPTDDTAVRLSGRLEEGEGWREYAIRLGLRLYFD